MSVRWLIVLALVCAGCGDFVESVSENFASERAEREAEETPGTAPLRTPDAAAQASAEEFFSEAAARVILPDFNVGDCFTVSFQTGGQGAEVVDCAEPHEGEVIHRFSFDRDAPFPDDVLLDERVGEECLPAFADHTGQVFEEQTALQIGYFSPTALSWEEGDRDVFCYLADAGGDDLQGSRGTGG
jgi:hypothetical protein